MNKYLPVILFVICIVIAVLLAWMVQPLWPAALAIAIAGGALAIALRALGTGETLYLIEDITALQDENTELRAEIARSHSMIDELADVVEQVAAVSAEPRSGASAEDLNALRVEMADMRAGALNAAPDETVLARLASVEAALSRRAESTDATLTLTDTVRPSPLAQAAPVAAAESKTVRSLIARAGESKDPTPPPASEAATNATLTPIFKPSLGAPVAFVLAPGGPDSPETVPSLLREATKIASELEDAGREILLFVSLSPQTLAADSARRDILAAIREIPALQRRLTLLTPQAGFDLTAQHTLAAIADEGCRFALESVRDWSLDLATLAGAGLGYIVVDGIAMAQSAEDQGGDPRRLAQALGAHGIDLIAGGVMIREDIETVRVLEPVLMMGDGLGIPRKLDAPA